MFFGQHRRSPVDAASRRRGMLQVRNDCAGFLHAIRIARLANAPRQYRRHRFIPRSAAPY
ncbi:hypothetical protein DF044_33430 [Burkholderia contaminans]|uniref:Uncharacterized protein n=1 Tax=Burkholderia contaminans TaxID=488447 RepID=A0A3N8RJG2_9BURK|nr:hypothetical protein [Burkholderia contaminans]TCW63147.1 hypothetical protein C5O79_35875 [Burkholderia sp. SRS-25]MBA9842499.1 hypothetical protein [Burkholderia contaminans]MBA9865590.1 hypothetical protein [Burkholderia contaminans]MBA9909991.1 hypothetical protein [Burkholderia contaminans]